MTTSIRIIRHDGTVETDSVTSKPTAVIERPTTGIEDLSRKRYRPVGKCIYCGTKDNLTREHVVPFGLSGNLVLPDSSCLPCATTTGAFELKVLRGSMRPVRLIRRLRSRRKHSGMANDATLDIVKAGNRESVRLPLDQYPILLPLPIFGPPRLLSGEAGSDITMKGTATILYGPRPEEVALKLNAEQIAISPNFDEPVAFARMIAKIAFSFAWAEGAFTKYPAPFPIAKSILGESNDIGQWVGTVDGPIEKYPGLLHRLSLQEEHGFLIAFVQLFSDSETPTYVVLLAPPL